jgi:pimeloyl-ACP methyl ester carboxylesterase
MPKCAANGLELFYEQYGDPTSPALLLISGLGAQITGWPERLLHRLADAGFFVTVYDNRDVGYSTWLTEMGSPDVSAIMSGDASAPYLLSDMADDGADLVRTLGLGPVHVVGVSMGGMIAQQFAIDHPDLTRSLTSIMSTPHVAEVGQPTPEAMASLVNERSEDFEQFMVEELEAWQLTAGSAYELDPVWIRAQAETAWARGRNADGVTRQMVAVMRSPDRRPLLASVTVPTLVLHGLEDL